MERVERRQSKLTMQVLVEGRWIIAGIRRRDSQSAGLSKFIFGLIWKKLKLSMMGFTWYFHSAPLPRFRQITYPETGGFGP
jgi:hypothetical protein